MAKKNCKDMEKQNETSLKDKFTILTLICSIVGIVYSGVLSPWQNYNELKTDIAVMKVSIQNVNDKVEWIQRRIR